MSDRSYRRFDMEAEESTVLSFIRDNPGSNLVFIASERGMEYTRTMLAAKRLEVSGRIISERWSQGTKPRRKHYFASEVSYPPKVVR